MTYEDDHTPEEWAAALGRLDVSGAPGKLSGRLRLVLGAKDPESIIECLRVDTTMRGPNGTSPTPEMGAAAEWVAAELTRLFQNGADPK